MIMEKNLKDFPLRDRIERECVLSLVQHGAFFHFCEHDVSDAIR